MTLAALIPLLLILGAGAGFAGGWMLGRRRRCAPAPTAAPIVLEHPQEEPHGELQYLFMGKVAHALRNPLTGVLMSAELLQEEDDPTHIRQALERILEQGRQIKEIIQRIQEATALEACQFHLELEAVPLVEVVEEVEKQFRPRLAVKGQVLEVESRDRGLVVVGDRRFLSSIVGELVSNAMKYSPKGARVRLGMMETGDGCSLWVQDEGPGVGAADHGNLFQRFGKPSTPPTAGESHLGLGLWTARVMAETLGEASVTSR